MHFIFTELGHDDTFLLSSFHSFSHSFLFLIYFYNNMFSLFFIIFHYIKSSWRTGKQKNSVRKECRQGL